MRIYLVESKNPDSPDRLVKATTKSVAISHSAKKDYTARVATQDDLVACLSEGIKVEVAGTATVEDLAD